MASSSSNRSENRELSSNTQESRKRPNQSTSDSSDSKQFKEDDSTHESPHSPGPPVDRSQGSGEKLYGRWYEKLNRFYSRLPTVYSEDTSTPNVEFNHLATVERRRYGAKRGKDITEFQDATIHGIDGYYEKAAKVEYKNILNCDKDTSGKRVVISGAPGCGKTTLSRKLCQDLYSQALPNQYRLVLLVELRKLKLSDTKGDINKVFENAQEGNGLQFLLGMSGASDTAQLCEKIQESEGEGVALILDGFDEVADHLGKSPFLSDLLSVEEPFLSECDVFVTTRPSQCPDLLSLMKRPHRHVEILGFTDTDIDQYIQHYFQEAYQADKEEAERRSKEVIQRLNSLSVVRGMCRIPMVLKIVCKVQDHLGSTPLPETVSGIFSAYICHQLVEYLVWASQVTGAPIEDVLNVPIDLFPGFYALCEVAYTCCSDKNGQRLILTEYDLKDVKEHLDKRGSIYNLLFSERVDKTAPSAGHLYQFNHKTVQETLAAIHIAKQSVADQQRIWKSEFGRPEMAEVWKTYCGITRLEWVDLTDLSLSSLSQRARDAGVPSYVDEEVVMTSLFEADNPSVSARVLPTLLKNSIRFRVSSPYNLHIVQSAVQNHSTLETLSLLGDEKHPLGVGNLASTMFVHKNLRKLKLSHFHPNDWKKFESSFKSPHNLKGIELENAPVDTVLAVLSGRVEEVQLNIAGVKYGNEDWRRIDDAVKANRNLKSFGIYYASVSTSPSGSFIDHLFMNETLKNTSCVILGNKDSRYFDIPDNSLKSHLVPREKCSVRMRLTPRQWCAVLSGLKDAKTLKELNVDMSQVPSSLHREEFSCAEISAIEEIVATSDQLVKVNVGCDVETSNLMLSIVKGVSRNRNISELGINYWISKEVWSGEHFLSLFETLAHTDHITRLRLECHYKNFPLLLGDNWCQLIIDGPMSRPVCHLELWLTQAECGVLLSRVHHAERLEELSLRISLPLWRCHDDVGDDVVRKVEDVWSNCALKKVYLEFVVSDIPQSLYNLLGAVMRGITANYNDVKFFLRGWSKNLNKDHLISQLGQEHVKQFEMVERGGGTYFISRPHASTENVESSLTSEKSFSEVVPVDLPSPHDPPGDQSEAISTDPKISPVSDQLLVYDRTPSDAGLEGVWDTVPVWERLAVKLGVPISTVESLQQNSIGCLKALQLWQSGRYRDKGFPPTWSFLLDAVEEISGPLIREKIADRVATKRTWTD